MQIEECYLKISNNKFANNNIKDIPLEHLRNYEFSKLLLKKNKFAFLNEKQQKNLNLDSVSEFMRYSRDIELSYNIPEITELLPEEVQGRLCLINLQIDYLPIIKRVKGPLLMQNSKIKSLPYLIQVDGNLNIEYSKIESFPELQSVIGSFYLRGSELLHAPKLSLVKDYFVSCPTKIEYWKNYFTKNKKEELAKKAFW